MESVVFPESEKVDFVIVGSGAAGGVMARELSMAGFTIVVLEQGPHLKSEDFRHDEWAYMANNELTWGSQQAHPQTFRRSEDETAELRDGTVLSYAHNVGGSSVLSIFRNPMPLSSAQTVPSRPGYCYYRSPVAPRTGWQTPAAWWAKT